MIDGVSNNGVERVVGQEGVVQFHPELIFHGYLVVVRETARAGFQQERDQQEVCVLEDNHIIWVRFFIRVDIGLPTTTQILYPMEMEETRAIGTDTLYRPP